MEESALELTDFRTRDGSRHFLSLPQDKSTFRLTLQVFTLLGAYPTAYLPGPDEAWIDFAYRGWKFSVHNYRGEFWFFVSDPACPESLLARVASHFAKR